MYRIGGSRRRQDASLAGGAVGIPLFCCRSSNRGASSASGTVSGGQFDWGGRLLKGNEALKGILRMDGNHSESVKAEGCLTARLTNRAERKLGLSDPAV